MNSGQTSQIDEASPADAGANDAATTSRRSGAHAIVVFAGHAGGTGLGFLATILMMRALGPEGFGVVAVSTVVMTILWLLTGRGLDQAMLRLVSRADAGATNDAAEIRGATLRMKLIYGGVFAIVGVALSGVLTRFFFGAGESVWPMILACVASLAASLWGFRTTTVQAAERFRAYAVLYAGNNAVRVAAILGFIGIGVLTPAWAMATAIVGFGVAALAGSAFVPALSRCWRRQAALEQSLFRYSKWLIVSSVIHQLYNSVDLLLLSRMTEGTETAGVYGAALRFIQMVDLLTVSVLTVVLPRVCRARNTQELRHQAGATLKTSAGFALLALPGYWLMGPVIGLIAPQFGPSVPLFQIIFIGAVIAMITHPLQAVLHAVGKTAWLTVMDVGLLAAAVVGHYLAIRANGSYGAAYMATGLRVLAGVVLSFIVWRIVRRDVPLGRGNS